MCRVMTITNLSKVKNVEQVLLKVRDLVSENNKDGFGYALSYKNSIFAEKFLDPSDFVGLNKKSLHEKMNLDIFDVSGSCSYGQIETTRPLALIAHGRTSTNYKGVVEYSHPFVNNDNAFVHNGVVDIWKNHGFELETKNDSEFLANVYWKNGLKGVQGVSGYYAFLNLQPGGRINIVKDTASLFGAYCIELDSYIFATLESMITRFASEFKLTLTKVYAVNEFTFFDVQLNHVIKSGTFTKTNKKEKKLTALERKAFKDYGTDYTSKFNDEDASTPSAFKDKEYWSSFQDDFAGSWKDDMPTTKTNSKRWKD